MIPRHLLVLCTGLLGGSIGCYTSDDHAPGTNQPPPVSIGRDDLPRPFVVNTPRRWPEDGPATCSVSPEGALVFQFRMDCSDRKPDGLGSRYVGCSLAEGQDLSRFHPDAGNSGVLAARVCAEGDVRGSLNLWYEDSKTRRFLPILGPDDRLSGCIVKYWLPEDSCLRAGVCGGFCGLADAGVDAYPEPATRGPMRRTCASILVL